MTLVSGSECITVLRSRSTSMARACGTRWSGWRTDAAVDDCRRDERNCGFCSINHVVIIVNIRCGILLAVVSGIHVVVDM